MFYGDKKLVTKSLHLMQRNVCCYDMGHMSDDQATFCDCKYGYNPKEKWGEQTGCPELRTVVELLNKMTEEEYTEILNRE
jgi:hypothetical protein